MSLMHKYTLLCDDVRVENTGKLIVLGLYTPDIGVPQIPFILPSLVFLQALESDRPGQYSFKCSLQHLETGKMLAQGMGLIQFPRPGLAINLIKFANIVFQNDGTYSLITRYDDSGEPFTTSFAVILPTIQVQPHGSPSG